MMTRRICLSDSELSEAHHWIWASPLETKKDVSRSFFLFGSFFTRITKIFKKSLQGIALWQIFVILRTAISFASHRFSEIFLYIPAYEGQGKKAQSEAFKHDTMSVAPELNDSDVERSSSGAEKWTNLWFEKSLIE